MSKIKVFTQNIYWNGSNKKDRISEIKEYIYYKKFDIIFLQEVIFNTDLSSLKNIDSKTDYYYVKGRFGPRGGLVTITKKKFEKVEFYKFKSQGTILSRQIFDRIIEKGFLVCYSGNTLYINTHLIATYDSERGSMVQQLNKQFLELINFIKMKIKEGKKIILAGDFNFSPLSNNYKELTRILKDNTSQKVRVKSKYVYGQKDYILSSKKKEKAIKYSEPFYPIYVSDHPGVGIELR